MSLSMPAPLAAAACGSLADDRSRGGSAARPHGVSNSPIALGLAVHWAKSRSLSLPAAPGSAALSRRRAAAPFAFLFRVAPASGNLQRRPLLFMIGTVQLDARSDQGNHGEDACH